MGTLYLVGTPIGNLEDMSFRAVRILGEVGLVAAEDTRRTRTLLRHYDIDTPLTSYHEYSKTGQVDALLDRIGREDVALVTDAGMPSISDPGYRLVQQAIEAGYPIVPIPGPTAAITALISSGLPTDKFLFVGFLPQKQQARRSALQEIVQQPYTLIFYVSPHRLTAVLEDMVKVLGDRSICLARELTKLYEELWRGTMSEAIVHFDPQAKIGELTLVVSGFVSAETEWDEPMIRDALQAALNDGLSRRDAIAKVVGESGWRKREVYKVLNESL